MHTARYGEVSVASARPRTAAEMAREALVENHFFIYLRISMGGRRRIDCVWVTRNEMVGDQLKCRGSVLTAIMSICIHDVCHVEMKFAKTGTWNPDAISRKEREGSC
jgi:hypothetical protein